MTLLAGCGGGGTQDPSEIGDGGDTTTTELEISATITLTEDQVFDPVVTEVAVGATVEWVNEDPNYMTHNIITPTKTNALPEDTFTESGTAWDFEAALLEDDSTEHTFEEAGVYEFYSQRGQPDADDERKGWEDICGAVVVGDAELTESLPCQE
jgi:plastocyanin